MGCHGNQQKAPIVTLKGFMHPTNILPHLYGLRVDRGDHGESGEGLDVKQVVDGRARFFLPPSANRVISQPSIEL